MITAMTRDVTYRLTPNLSLAHKIVDTTKQSELTNIGIVDHLFIVDISGSMGHNLETLRIDLKNELSSVVGVCDTVTIVWFSSRSEWGVIKERVHINSPQQLESLKKDIDRYLRPQGLTGFKDPLEFSVQFCKESKETNRLVTLSFLTDGHDNQSKSSELLQLCETLSPLVNVAVVLGVGPWINTSFLLEMTEKLGGIFLHSNNIQELTVLLNKVFSGEISVEDKVVVDLDFPAQNNLVYTLTTNGIAVYSTQEQSVLLPRDTKEIWYWTRKEADHSSDSLPSLKPLYASIALLHERGESNQVYSALKNLGDVRIIDKFVGAYGPDRQSEFQNQCKAIALGKYPMFKDGRNVNHLPREDAYCVLELFHFLASCKAEWRFDALTDYKKISQARDNSGAMTPEAIQSLKDILVALRAENKNSKVEALIDKLSTDVTSNSHKKTLEAWTRIQKYVKAKSAKELVEKGLEILESVENVIFKQEEITSVPFNNFVWNEKRANLSVKFSVRGVAHPPENKFKIDSLPVFTYRTYTFIRDGFLNIRKLHFTARPEFIAKLEEKAKEHNFSLVWDDIYSCFVIDLEELPLINREMVTTASAEKTFLTEIRALKNKAALKVYKEYFKELDSKPEFKSKDTLTKMYGVEAQEWLQSKGVMDNLEYSPKGARVKSGDVYQAVTLAYKVKGLSSFPKVQEVVDRIDSQGNLTPSMKMMESHILAYREKVKEFEREESKDALLKTWLEMEITKRKMVGDRLATELNTDRFTIIIGQSWFKEFATRQDNSIMVEFHGEKYQCSAVLSTQDIEI